MKTPPAPLARIASTALLAVAVCAVPSLGEDAADLILRDGVFYPVATPGAVRGSLAVRGGRIAYLGDDAGAAALAGPGTEVVELGGRTVTPGLIDAHSHLLSLGAALEEVDLVGTASYEEVVERIRAAAAALPPGAWVRGRGWDQNDWPVQAFPDHRRLSAAVPDRPVWVNRIDGHAALLNSKAMELLGLDPGVADPAGGRFLRDPSGGLTGVLVDEAMSVAGAGLPGPTDADRRRRIAAAAAHCLERGLTTVTELGVGGMSVATYVALREAGELPLRVALFLTDAPALLDLWLASGPRLDPGARLTVRGIKLYADGALGSRGAALVEPYSDDPGNLGLLITGGERLAGICRRALAAGFQVGIHAIGDRGALVALDALEACFERPRPEARFRIEHAQVMRLQDIGRMAGLGVIASMQPTHATSDMPWAGERVGDRRLDGAYAWRRVIEAGGRLALGSDFPVESADPRLGLYAAVTRQDAGGRPAGGWLPDQRLSREEALRGFTLDAAHALFLESEIGSLEVGKRADLVVFGRDIMTVPAAEIPAVEVDLTLVEGEIAYRRRETP